jgi:hypothetical protein
MSDGPPTTGIEAERTILRDIGRQLYGLLPTGFDRLRPDRHEDQHRWGRHGR